MVVLCGSWDVDHVTCFRTAASWRNATRIWNVGSRRWQIVEDVRVPLRGYNLSGKKRMDERLRRDNEDDGGC